MQFLHSYYCHHPNTEKQQSAEITWPQHALQTMCDKYRHCFLATYPRTSRKVRLPSTLQIQTHNSSQKKIQTHNFPKSHNKYTFITRKYPKNSWKNEIDPDQIGTKNIQIKTLLRFLYYIIKEEMMRWEGKKGRNIFHPTLLTVRKDVAVQLTKTKGDRPSPRREK